MASKYFGNIKSKAAFIWVVMQYNLNTMKKNNEKKVNGRKTHLVFLYLLIIKKEDNLFSEY